MREPEDRIFTGEPAAADEFYEALLPFAREQQQRLQGDDRASALLQLDLHQPYSPEALTLVLLALLRGPAREEFLDEFPPQRLAGPRDRIEEQVECAGRRDAPVAAAAARAGAGAGGEAAGGRAAGECRAPHRGRREPSQLGRAGPVQARLRPAIGARFQQRGG